MIFNSLSKFRDAMMRLYPSSHTRTRTRT